LSDKTDKPESAIRRRHFLKGMSTLVVIVSCVAAAQAADVVWLRNAAADRAPRVALSGEVLRQRISLAGQPAAVI
jgi:hypothetical protein